MKPKIAFLAAMLIFFSSSMYAQGKKIANAITSAKDSVAISAIAKTNNKVTEKFDDLLDWATTKKKAKKGDAAAEPDEFVPGHGKSLFTISNCNYSSLSGIMAIIKANENVKDIDDSFSNGTGVLKIVHSGKCNDILGDLLSKTKLKLEVTGKEDSKINLQIN